ncbi:MAG: CoA transferase, partial [Actinomycetales bacterium]|nr:CoA transferase [Actinomycetales bacterium]
MDSSTNAASEAGSESQVAELLGVLSAEPLSTGPLAGILVADFSRVLAGPLATMTLADMGARV